MTISRSRLLALSAALALGAAGAQAQLKVPQTGKPATGVRPAPAPAAPAPAPAAAAAPAQAAPSAATEKEAAGQLAAAAWLTLLDRRDWGRAWDGSSAMFRASVPLGAWMDGIPKVREPLGALQERNPLDAVYKTELTGKPNGDYVTVSFASKFSNKADAEEVVTTVLEPDGKWRVTGYQTR